MTLDFTIHGLIDLFAQVVNINGSSVAIGEIDFIISEGDNRLETNVIPLTVVPNNGRFLQEKTVNISQKIPAGKTIIPPLGAPYIEPGTFSIYLRDYTYAYAIGSRTVPEPTSTLSLLAFGTLGAASTLKRKLKSSRSSEKETTQVS